MVCPECNTTDNAVTDSRESGSLGYASVRRRRRCACGHVFTTHEVCRDKIHNKASLAEALTVLFKRLASPNYSKYLNDLLANPDEPREDATERKAGHGGAGGDR